MFVTFSRQKIGVFTDWSVTRGVFEIRPSDKHFYKKHCKKVETAQTNVAGIGH